MDRTVHWVVENGIGRITLAHPPLNVLTRAVLADLQAAVRAVGNQAAVRVVILDAEGRHFSAGADVGEHLPPTYRALIPEFARTVQAVDALPIPVVAAVQGRCVGGGMELVLAADIVLAAEGAVFGQPEICLGVFPPVACAWLPESIPRGAAAELIYTGETVSAAEAARLGIVTRLVADADLVAAARELAGRIARHSAAALRVAKRGFRLASARWQAVDRQVRLYLEELMDTADAVEGLRAFLEKRQPEWAHR